MKKFKALLLALAMTFALAACGTETVTLTETPEPTQEPSEQPVSSPVNTDVPVNTSAPAGDGSTLVVYFSATGNTEAVANYIANATGADVFTIEPAQPYTSDDLRWTDEDSRVVQEYEDESLRDIELVSTDVPNWDSYDTVFIGYPIWWGIAAWPVSSFVSANDFSGKTVIPFCTSASSGLGQSGELLEQAAGSGTWLVGMRFSSGVSESDVTEWVESLGL